jgi:hypothetical protein
MRTNHVLIDFESVQPDSLAALEQQHFHVHVFVGANQAKLSFDVANAIQRMGARANYIKISGNGPNALDFHIAFYIGKIAAADSSTFFHIISKDAGFDPLIQHLKSLGIFADRCKTIEEIPLVKVSSARSPEERLTAVINRLTQMKASTPRTVKTLRSTIATVFQKQLTEADIDALVAALVERKVLSISGNKVLPPA